MIRGRLAHEWEHLCPGLRLSDDLEATVGFERALDPVEDEPMVVGDNDAHRNSVAQGPDAASGSPGCATLRGPRRGERSLA